MEFESTNNGTTAKLPILKLKNGNSWVSVPQTAQENGTSVTKMYVPVTAEEKTNKKNNVKDRSLLLMALPNEHQLTFSQYPDAKSMFAAIETRFGGNEATRKTQKTLLNTSSTNDVNTTSPQVSTVSPNVNTVSPQGLEQIREDDLEAMDLKWQLSLLSMKAKRYYQRTCKKIFINANDTAGYQDNTRKQGNNKDTSSKAMLAIDGVSFDWSDMAEEQLQTNIALMAFSDSENEVLISEEIGVLKREVACKDYELGVLKTEFEKVKQEKEGIDFKIEKFDKASKDLNQLLESQITDKKPEFNRYVPRDTVLKYTIECGNESENSKENTDDSLVKEQVSEDENSSVESPLNVVKETVFHAAKKTNCHHYQRKKMVTGDNYNMVDHDYYAKTSHLSTHRNMTPREVLLKFGLTPLSTARHVYTAHPKPTVHSARSISHFSKQSQSIVQRPFYKKTTLTNRHIYQKVNTVRPRVVNTARPYIASVNTVRAKGVNVVKPSACWVWKPTRPNGALLGKPQMNDKGFVDSECSRHMTGNMTYLSNFKEFNGGYVTFSVSQMCDKKNYVLFTDTECLVLSPNFKLPDESQILLKIPRKDNMYSFDIKNIVPKESLTCLVAKATSDESMLWHRRLGHINFKNINKLVKENLVKGLPKKRFENDQTCVACLKGKKHRASSRTPQQNGVAERRNRTLIEAARTMLANSKLPTTFWVEAVSTACYVKNRVLVIKPHNKTPYELFRGFKPALSFMKPFGCHVTILNTLDSLGKFDGKSDEAFFVGYSLIAAGTNSNKSAGTQGNLNVGTFTATSQDCIVMPIWKDASYFDSPSKEVGNDDPKSAIDNPKQDEEGPNNENEDKDDSSPKEDNTANQQVNTARASHSFEATHVEFFNDEYEPKVDLGNIPNSYLVPTTPNTRIHKDHLIENVIGQVKSSVQTRRMTHNTNEQGFISDVYEGKTHEHLYTCLFACFLSQEEPKRISKALSDPAWIEAMQEELLQFKLQKVWILMDLPKGHKAIGTKWIFRNKKDERGIVIRNKARLVAQGHTQEEGVDYDEVFAPVARIEAIRLFLAYASFMGFMVYQTDVKSAFLYGQIEEEVYMCQPLGFEDPGHPDKVYKVVKVLYGLHQAPRAWYETLTNYLLGNGFHKGKIDQTLFIKKKKGDILLVQIYVDDIIFSFIKKELCTEFEKLMKDKFQMSSMGELTFFLGLQVQQKKDGIFISQDKYVDEILRKFNYTNVKSASTPVDLEKPLVKDGDATDVDEHLYRSMIGSLMYLTASRPDIMFALDAYTDSDYAGATQDSKSTTGGCQFLGNRLISWQCKKQTMVATSTTEAKYVAATSCCRQSNKNEWKDMLHQKKVFKYIAKSKEVKKLRYLSLVVPLKKVGDEAVHKELGDRMERAATTASSLEVEQDSDAQTRFEAASKSPMTHLSQELTHLEVGRTCIDVNAAQLQLNAAKLKHMLMLPVQVPAAEVAFLEKPAESDGFAEIIDFLKASSVHYALTVNPIIYTSCIQQFWATTQVKTVNRVRQLQALIDKKKMIITELSIRSDLHLEDA
ncbi:putative ribonuclease H-like domain-containing protein [Tanacetum coccineum]